MFGGAEVTELSPGDIRRLVAPWLGPTSLRRKLRIPRAWPDLPEVTNQLCNAAGYTGPHQKIAL
eukprot:scaffold89639_cov75-Phaeocystis_antarctica.AAC.1